MALPTAKDMLSLVAGQSYEDLEAKVSTLIEMNAKAGRREVVITGSTIRQSLIDDIVANRQTNPDDILVRLIRELRAQGYKVTPKQADFRDQRDSISAHIAIAW